MRFRTQRGRTPLFDEAHFYTMPERSALSIAYDSVNVDNASCTCDHDGGSLIPLFEPETGALPPGDHEVSLEEIAKRLGFTARRRWLLKGLRAAVQAFWAAGVEEVYLDGSFCTEKPDPGSGSTPIGSTSLPSWCSQSGNGNVECGPTTASSFLSTRGCGRPLRKDSQTFFATTATDGRAA